MSLFQGYITKVNYPDGAVRIRPFEDEPCLNDVFFDYYLYDKTKLKIGYGTYYVVDEICFNYDNSNDEFKDKIDIEIWVGISKFFMATIYWNEGYAKRKGYSIG